MRELRILYVDRVVQPSIAPAIDPLTPPRAGALFQALLGNESVEVIGVLCLNTRLQMLCYHELGRGTLDHVVAHPREVMKVALLANASAVVIGHNHPSGMPEPSLQDGELTQRLAAVGQLVGIDVVDHVIVGHDGQYRSFKELGRL